MEGQDTLEYTAHVTGRSYEDENLPTLDSISFVLRSQKIKEIQTVTIEKITQQKPRKWHISAQGGYGYGITTRKPDVFVGIGISYDIW